LKLSVIIVNYNVKYFLEQCLYSVEKASGSLETEVFVVDNHSSDGSRAFLEKKFPRVHFKWNNENTGFAKANNSVLKETKGEYILFLNPDTIVPEDCFEKCLGFFASHTRCGALGVRMIDGAGFFLKESKRSFPTPAFSFYKMTGLAKLFPSSAVFAGYYAGHLTEHESHEVDVLAGAFMMISKEAMLKTGGFDEAFFMYGEDIDLSYRLQKQGYKNYYFPGTTIIHFKGESTQKNSAGYVKHFYDAMQLFVRKHYGDKKNKTVLMSAAIGCSRWLAKRKLITTGKQENKTPAPSIMVVAGQSYFDVVIQLIKYATPPRVISGRVSISPNDHDAATGTLAGLAAAIEIHQADELLFCAGEMSYATIISYMQELKGRIAFLLHASNSDSMVGSADKNGNGIFIARV
jgi:GT2 family glycosyltransferase